MDWNFAIKELEKTYNEALEQYKVLADGLMRVDADTLTSSQWDVEKMLGYIASLQTQLLALKGIINKCDELIRVSKDTINKTQRAISQAIKEAKII